jgi:hypothetical protein
MFGALPSTVWWEVELIELRLVRVISCQSIYYSTTLISETKDVKNGVKGCSKL